MRFASISTLLCLAACVSAATINVLVGQDGALTFTPNSVNASEGDTVAFQFLTGNHTLTQSTFTDPCTRLSTGIDSDFQPTSANASMVPQYSFSVTNTSSLWFYCRQGRHCQSGMVFAVNPTADESFDAFRATATGTNTTSPSASSSSKSVPSQSGSSPSPSASGYSNAAPGFDSSKIVGVVSLVGILVGSAL